MATMLRLPAPHNACSVAAHAASLPGHGSRSPGLPACAGPLLVQSRREDGAVCQHGLHAAGAALVFGVRAAGTVAGLGGLRPDRGDAEPCRRAHPVPGPAGRGPAGGDIAAGRACGPRPVRGPRPGTPTWTGKASLRSGCTITSLP